MFLRVFLMHQYKGGDQVKLLGTLPCSLQFETFVFEYMVRLLEGLLKKYPQSLIEEWRSRESVNLNCKFKRIFY